eukprot:TRINITY_DN3249_c0_g1_i1.p1 TRINITY_DN3249_c0_g1~~TRINITY_DN3249_c0_g1_i1.p1  ORF type:complete len:244 (-),score=39.42 TRINITY_DN3249_c0_g1_i1:331-1008(-)
MLARERIPVTSSSLSLTPGSIVLAIVPRIQEAPRKCGLKTTPGLRPLRPRNLVSAAGPTASKVPRAAAPLVRATIGLGSNERSCKRPRLCDTLESAIEAMPRQKAMRFIEAFQDSRTLNEKCSELQADVDQCATEFRAVQQQTKALLEEGLKSLREKKVLEERANAARCKSKEESVCVICLTDQASHIIVPCGHLVLCGECCSQPIHTCPLCRQTCQHKLRVFKP